MDGQLFERLLYEDEGPTLDFKQEQYRFAKATDEEKSELLKDIIGFANAWRRSDAYILIGVEDVRGGRSNIVGVTEHLDDHSLQQFVNNLTNQPVRFRYEASGVEGKQVGIIHVDEQTRPVYLKRDYGKLKKNEVYVRRGSSTDPTKPASLEEIAQMRIGTGHPVAELTVEFADLDTDALLGSRLTWMAELCDIPPRDSIPSLSEARRHPLIAAPTTMYLDRTNDSYYRQLADYEFARRFFRPVGLIVKNVGQVAAQNMRVELQVSNNLGVSVLYPRQMPDPPKKTTDMFPVLPVGGLRAVLRRSPGEVVIEKNQQRIRIAIDCGDLQPGRWVKSDRFFIGKQVTGEIMVAGQAFADNLPQPKAFDLAISVTVAKGTITVAQLRCLPEPATSDD